jgi:hypothetical protein
MLGLVGGHLGEPKEGAMSVHRLAAVLGGAAVLAALSVPGSAAAPAVEAARVAPAAAPVATTIGPVGTLVSAGSVVRIDVTFSCPTKSTGSVTVEGHQNVGGGFVANGFGYSRQGLTCDGKKHTLRLTVSPTGERGFRRGPAYVLADLAACPANAEVCNPVSAERTVSVR